MPACMLRHLAIVDIEQCAIVHAGLPVSKLIWVWVHVGITLILAYIFQAAIHACMLYSPHAVIATSMHAWNLYVHVSPSKCLNMHTW